MSSLINSQHQFRQATRERGIIELKMQMIDVRCGAMQSIATQATLVAGFAFGSLQPDTLDTLWATHEASWVQYPFSIAFVLCASIAFASSIWVIYTSLYAGWRAQFSALQGGTLGMMAGDAVDESLQIILLTTERVAKWFSCALGFTTLGVTLLAFAHLPWVSFGLLFVFGFFTYDGITFRRKMDGRFRAIGDGFHDGRTEQEAPVTTAKYTPSRSCCVEVSSVPSTSSSSAGGVGGASLATVGGGGAGGGGARAMASPATAKAHYAPSRRQSRSESHLHAADRLERERVERSIQGGEDDGLGSSGAPSLSPAAAQASETPPEGQQHPSSFVDGSATAAAAAASQSVRVSGWLFKSPSRLGPPAARKSCVGGVGGGGGTELSDGGIGGGQKRVSAASLLAVGRAASQRLSLLGGSSGESIPNPQDKRFFVLDGTELRWYSNKDEVTLGMSPKTTIDMRHYSCRVVDADQLILSLVPELPPAKKSWYLRAEDSESYETWKWALGTMSADRSGDGLGAPLANQDGGTTSQALATSRM
jgi:hypothetical protein